MGYITYPRSSGSGKDIKRAQAALLLIEQLLYRFNPSDLGTLLALVSQIGWANLPPALRARLLQLLYYELFESIKSRTLDDASTRRKRVQMMTKSLVDIALSSSDRIDLPLHERINASGHLSVTLAPKVSKSRYGQEVLIFDNGMHVVLTASRKGEKYSEDQEKEIRTAGRAYEPPSRQTIKAAHKKGELVTLNLLSDYMSKGTESTSDRLTYDIEKIPEGVLSHSVVRREILRSICRPIDTYSRQKRQSFPGQEREHIIPHSCFTERSQHTGEPRSKVPLREGVGDYTELSALTYPVEDGQTQGTEHRLLTIQAVKISRQFRAERREATLLEWLDKVQEATYELFTVVRVCSDEKPLPRFYSKAEARVIASCIRQEAQLQFEKLKMPMTMLLSNKIADLKVGAELPELASADNDYVEF